MKQNKQSLKLAEKAYRLLQSNPENALDILRDKEKSIGFPLQNSEFCSHLKGLVTKGGAPPSYLEAQVLYLISLQNARNLLKIKIQSLQKNVTSFGKDQIAAVIAIANILSQCIPIESIKSINPASFNLIGTRAAHKILKFHFKDDSKYLSEEDYLDVLILWRLISDDMILNEIQSAILYDSHFLRHNDNGTVFYNVDIWNKNTEVKAKIRTQFYNIWNKEKVNANEHFKINDIEYKTDQGFAGIMVSHGAEILKSPDGATWINGEVDTDGFFSQQSFQKMYTQWFYSYYRMELQKYYVPKEFDEIHNQLIQVGKHEFNSYTVISICSVFSAYSILLEYFISFFKQGVMNSINDLDFKEMNDIAYFVQKIVEHPVLNGSFAFLKFSLDELYLLIQDIEDLKILSIEGFEIILDQLLVKEKEGGLIKSSEGYLLLPQMLLKCNYAELIYQRVIASNLYSKKGENADADKNQRKREKAVCDSVQELFKASGFKVIVNKKYEYVSKECKLTKGEFDILVVSEEEKIALLFELKLNNTGAYNSYGRHLWKSAHLNKATEQLRRGHLFFEMSQEGAEFASQELGLNITGYTFEYFLLTDNFIADHEILWINRDRDLCATICTTFELQCLLRTDNLIKGLIPLRKEIINGHTQNTSLKELNNCIVQNKLWTMLLSDFTFSKNVYNTSNLAPRFEYHH